MDTQFFHQEGLHKVTSSVREHRLYRAEKMVMRQFLLMKLHFKVPFYLHMKDLKKWLLCRRSFLEEFEEAAKVAEPRKLRVAELVWTLARVHLLNHMEEELYSELKKEKLLSMLFRRTVTLEGLQIFLSTFHPKAEQYVRMFLDYLTDRLLNISCAGHGCSSLTLHLKLQRAFAPLDVKVVDAALEFLFSEEQELVEVTVASRSSSLASALRNRAEAVSARIGEQLAEAAAPCLCLISPLSEAVLKHLCTSVTLAMVRDLHHSFDQRLKKFHLLDFDESLVSARQAATCAIQDMEDRVNRDAYLQARQEQIAPSLMCAVWRMKQAMMIRTQRGG